MASWRLAKSIQRLKDEIESEHRGTTFWTIGDEAHQSTWSDHNPSECCNVVCAGDIKGNGGLNLPNFVNHLITNPHPNLRYVIYNRKIYQRKNGWRTENYSGRNAHADHVHVSVGNGPDGRSTSNYDSTASWGIADISSNPPPKPSVPASNWTQEVIMALPTLRKGAKGADVGRLQGLLVANGYKDSAIDHIFGAKTDKALRRFQKNKKVRNSVTKGNGDGIAGRYSWTALLGE